MLFDKSKYYKYIKDIKFEIGLIYSIYSILFFLISSIIGGYFNSILIAILVFALGICCASLHTKSLEIKVQEMYYRIDIYEKIMNKKEG